VGAISCQEEFTFVNLGGYIEFMAHSCASYC